MFVLTCADCNQQFATLDAAFEHQNGDHGGFDVDVI